MTPIELLQLYGIIAGVVAGLATFTVMFCVAIANDRSALSSNRQQAAHVARVAAGALLFAPLWPFSLIVAVKAYVEHVRETLSRYP